MSDYGTDDGALGRKIVCHAVNRSGRGRDDFRDFRFYGGLGDIEAAVNQNL